MATYDALKSEHQTLSTTTVDTVKLTQFWPYIEVANKSTSTALYFSQTNASVTSAAEDSDYVAPGQSILVRARIQADATPGSTSTPPHIVYVVGSGNAYSVTGVQG
jgi:hypothetical protein